MNDYELTLIAFLVIIITAVIIIESRKPTKPKKINTKIEMIEDIKVVFYVSGKIVGIRDLKVGDIIRVKEYDLITYQVLSEMSPHIVTEEAHGNEYGETEIKAKWCYGNHDEISIGEKFYYDKRI